MLVLEILAGRLVAPYVGVTIETFTGIIGVVLAGIAIGAWMGGRAADRWAPRPLLGPLLVAGGVLALLAPTIVHLIGPSLRAAGPVEIVVIALLPFFLPAAVLSAVPPIVVKLSLDSLDQTGSVVGTLSAVSTAGAIFGTFATGFILIAAMPTNVIVITVGIVLLLVGGLLWMPRGRPLLALPLPALVAVGLLIAVDGPCDEESTYFCAFVTVDPHRPTGRVLWLDTLRHSYVDLDDPTHLEFRYGRVMADVMATMPPGALDALYIGGGGFTLPRYVATVRKGSVATVLELDASLVDIAQRDLGLDPDTVRTVIGDARVSLRDEPVAGYDLVIGDAFGGRSVPWHLTTREFAADIRARLRPGGIYLINLIDHPPLAFARAEAATLAEVFDTVAVIAPSGYLSGDDGGNFVMIAGDAFMDMPAIQAAVGRGAGGEALATGDDLADFIDGSAVLRDDHAPVDQLLGRP